MRKKVVLDTNVLLNYLDHGGDGFEVVLRIIEKCKELEIVSCPRMLNELVNTLYNRRKIAPRFADMLVRNLITTLEGFEKISICKYVPQHLILDMSRKDKYFCEFSVQTEVSYVISNDEHHFSPVKDVMRENYNIAVVSCSDFLTIEGHLEDWNRFNIFTLY
ncbi:MAG: PIN domain-containing protein [Promethearchaeota archaeon]